jgi:hypothetical protein
LLFAKNKNGNYELISGLRILLVVQKLGHKTIKPEVIDTPQTDFDVKAYSFTENLVRKHADVVNPVAIDAITEAFRRYGSIKAVCSQI